MRVFRRMFLITQFLATEALGKNTHADMRQSASSFPLFVSKLSKMCKSCILRLNLTSQLFVQRVLRSRLTQTCIYKLESSEAYLPKLEKNLSQGFEIVVIFCKNAVLNICRSLKRFYTYKKIKNIFLKFNYSLLRMPKIMEIGHIIPAEKRDSKT